MDDFKANNNAEDEELKKIIGAWSERSNLQELYQMLGDSSADEVDKILQIIDAMNR